MNKRQIKKYLKKRREKINYLNHWDTWLIIRIYGKTWAIWWCDVIFRDFLDKEKLNSWISKIIDELWFSFKKE